MTTLKILRLWVKKGLVAVDTPLYETAKKFARAICEMDCDDNEKYHFADTITKIYE